MPDQSLIKRFSVSKEKEEINNLFQQIIKVHSFVQGNDDGSENLVSIRYLLRKQFFTRYCNLIRSTLEGLKKCVCPQSDKELVENVKKTNQPYFTYCHAGLVDLAFPLSTSNHSIVLIGGQFLFEPPSRREQQKLLDKVKDLPLNQELLRSEIKYIPVIPMQTMKSIIALIITISERFPDRNVLEIISTISGKHSPKQEKVHNVISFLKSHYSEQYSLREIADNAGLSPYYLAHIFPQELGCSVMQYRKNLRLAMAKEMLINTEMPIIQIAFDLGWNDSNYFSLVFKKETGFSPSSFRHSSQKS